MNVLDDFGDRLRFLRKCNGTSQIELGKAIGFSRSAIRNWEVGATKPSLEDIVKLANHFQVTTDFLLGMDKNRTIQLDFISDRAFVAVSNMIKVIREDYEKDMTVKLISVNQVK